VQKLNQETLSSENMQNLKASMEHLNQATSALAQSSKKLDGVIEQAEFHNDIRKKKQLTICRARSMTRARSFAPLHKAKAWWRLF